jgi:hypothetical protein
LFPNYHKEKKALSFGVRVSGTAHACAKVIRGGVEKYNTVIRKVK